MKQYNVDKINALDIVQVARDLDITLKKKGTKHWAQCLWHSDTNPSMVVGGSGGNFAHCFACGESSSVAKLIMKKLGCDFKTACQWAVDNFPTEDLIEDGVKKPGVKLRKVEKLQARPKKEAEKKEFDEFPSDFSSGVDGMGSTFAYCLREVFGNAIAEDVVRMYRLGAISNRGRLPDVLFPSIDIEGRIRDMKVQSYDSYRYSDRFFHCLRNVCYWLGPTLYKDKQFNRECLFGEHLLRQHPDKTIALVESPKNACVGAAAYPKYLWLATGNKAMLKREVLEVLRGRRVVVFPDEDAFQSWSDKLSHMQDIATFVLIHAPGTDEKRDIADFIIKYKLNFDKNEDNNRT